MTTRAARFDEMVLDAAETLEHRLGHELGVELAELVLLLLLAPLVHARLVAVVLGDRALLAHPAPVRARERERASAIGSRRGRVWRSGRRCDQLSELRGRCGARGRVARGRGDGTRTGSRWP